MRIKTVQTLAVLTRVAGVALAALASGVMAPASAQKSRAEATIDFGGSGAASKSIVLPLDKAAIVELPQAAADVLVSQPAVVDAVIRSPQRVYLLGLTVGQTNAFFFDGSGRQILNLEIRVERDLDALTELINRLIPDARVTAEAVNDNIILKATADARCCERVTVTNCSFRTMCAALGLGAETTKGLRDIAFSNCVVEQALRAGEVGPQCATHQMSAAHLEGDTRSQPIIQAKISPKVA